MNIIFFHSKTFLTNEITNAVRQIPGLRLINVPLPVMPTPETAPIIFEQLKSYLPAVILSVNDAGYDSMGVLNELIGKSGSYQCNWFCDHPLYESIFKKRQRPIVYQRLDFVTEEWFVNPMRAAGLKAHFLPLATDPAFFNTQEPIALQRDIAFVGNSTLEFIDTLMGEPGLADALEAHAPLMRDLKERYTRDPRDNLYEYLQSHPELWHNTIRVDQEQFLFAMEWMAGYLYRRDFIVTIAGEFSSRFTCFGDGYWERFIKPEQVSTQACYYTNLCSYYRSTKINLNINRVQIRTAFTQRIFDCLASSAFLLTERRALNARYFKTEGPDQEIVQFDSLDHCRELIRHYLNRDDERQRIAAAGKKNVLANHTYRNRLEIILDHVRREWGI